MRRATRCIPAVHELQRLVASPVRTRFAAVYFQSEARTTCQHFSASARSLKKNNKGGKNNASEDKVAPESTDDPLSVDDLQVAIQKALAKLKEDLGKLRSDGRFNPEVVESLRVTVEKGTQNTERLGDLAQVVPKGRTINILVGDKDHVKQISSAILGSSLNLNPQPDPHNSNQLNITLPTPTADSRKAVVQEAANVADTASSAIKNARATQQKKFKAAQKAARPDDVKAASKSMEKIVADANTEAKKLADAAKKVLEGS